MRPRALVFEDDPDTRRTLAEMLGECGLDAVTSDHEDLPDAEALALVLTDLLRSAAGYSSFAATRWVARLRRAYGAPILVVTGHPQAWDDGRLRRVAVDVLRKPLDLDDLQARVAAIVTRDLS